MAKSIKAPCAHKSGAPLFSWSAKHLCWRCGECGALKAVENGKIIDVYVWK